MNNKEHKPLLPETVKDNLLIQHPELENIFKDPNWIEQKDITGDTNRFIADYQLANFFEKTDQDFESTRIISFVRDQMKMLEEMGIEFQTLTVGENAYYPDIAVYVMVFNIVNQIESGNILGLRIRTDASTDTERSGEMDIVKPDSVKKEELAIDKAYRSEIAIDKRNNVESQPHIFPKKSKKLARRDKLIEQASSIDEEPEDYLINLLNSGLPVDNIIGIYLREATQIPLLTQDEEIALSIRIEKGKQAREELADNKVGKRRRDELIEVIKDETLAHDHLIMANIRLVISVAKKYVGRGVPFLDLIQEGNIGLIRASKKFDYKRGYKFSTYATWWIRQAVTRAMRDYSSTIRIPVHMGDLIGKYRGIQQSHLQLFGKLPTDEEMAEAMGYKNIEKIERAIRRTKIISLETPIDDEGSVLSDFIEDNAAKPPEEIVFDNITRAELQKMLDEKLPPREARLLALRYGFPDGEPRTLNEVGKKMGVTRERVRQLEAQAISRLRGKKISKRRVKVDVKEVIDPVRHEEMLAQLTKEYPSINALFNNCDRAWENLPEKNERYTNIKIIRRLFYCINTPHEKAKEKIAFFISRQKVQLSQKGINDAINSKKFMSERYLIELLYYIAEGEEMINNKIRLGGRKRAVWLKKAAGDIDELFPKEICPKKN